MRTKSVLFCAIFFFAAITSNGQINEGRFLLGGAFSFNSSSNENFNSVFLNVQFGKVIKENTVVGIIGSINSSNYNAPQKYKVNQYAAGLFYRKYKPLAKNLYFFGEVDATYNYSKNIQYYFPNVTQSLATKSNGGTLSFVPGISYAITKRIQMELSMPNIATISYTDTRTIDSSLPPTVSAQKATNFSASANVNSNLFNNFGIGFKFLLGK